MPDILIPLRGVRISWVPHCSLQTRRRLRLRCVLLTGKKITSVPIQKLLPAGSTRPSAQPNQRISELSRSPIGFGSNVSLSTLHLLCYRRRCKTRYVVVWFAFYDRTFTRKNSTAFPSAPSTSQKISISLFIACSFLEHFLVCTKTLLLEQALRQFFIQN